MMAFMPLAVCSISISLWTAKCCSKSCGKRSTLLTTNLSPFMWTITLISTNGWLPSWTIMWRERPTPWRAFRTVLNGDCTEAFIAAGSLKTAQACFLDGHPFELQSGMVIREEHIMGIAGSSFYYKRMIKFFTVPALVDRQDFNILFLTLPSHRLLSVRTLCMTSS